MITSACSLCTSCTNLSFGKEMRDPEYCGSSHCRAAKSSRKKREPAPMVLCLGLIAAKGDEPRSAEECLSTRSPQKPITCPMRPTGLRQRLLRIVRMEQPCPCGSIRKWLSSVNLRCPHHLQANTIMGSTRIAREAVDSASESTWVRGPPPPASSLWLLLELGTTVMPSA